MPLFKFADAAGTSSAIPAFECTRSRGKEAEMDQSETQAQNKDLSDPGIAQELGQEAIDDIKTTAQDAAGRVSELASDAAEKVSHTAAVAYERPGDFVEYVFRSTKRFVQRRPLDAVIVAAGVAFVAGALYQVGRR